MLLNHIQYGRGADVIFLHGWGANLDSFQLIAKAISNDYRVTLVDFWGFGKSEHPDYPLKLADYVLSIIRLINHYKMKNVTLVAHSFGARVALKIAHDYGFLLDRIVIVNGAGVKPRRKLKYYYSVIRHKILRYLRIPHKAGSKDYRKLSPVMKETFKNVINEDLTPMLKYISLPTLLIWGNKDKETPLYMARKMHNNIINSGIVILRDAGHFSFLDQSQKFIAILKSFLESKG